MSDDELQVSELADDAVMLDVREPDEWTAGHAPGAVHIPLGELSTRTEELPSVDGGLPVVCRSGGRSGRAVEWLRGNGFEVRNVAGGMQAWQGAGKEMVAESGGEPTVS
ncbi:rhodanese-like domain-containing protein [Marihabitans asiaticum]|uniref:Rhodanese-related sulfurtransferase n=1 Tax=Marihabitans asiaticum TaxID=415218 RepID=A0A560WFS1_9MICO|nr:rhodanese-like domain-containing protein [Marihabitans asiaticum]TWD16531.1 rhodanese-related sulfurtransferase [Marihabitans asiaticum]